VKSTGEIYDRESLWIGGVASGEGCPALAKETA